MSYPFSSKSSSSTSLTSKGKDRDKDRHHNNNNYNNNNINTNSNNKSQTHKSSSSFFITNPSNLQLSQPPHYPYANGSISNSTSNNNSISGNSIHHLLNANQSSSSSISSSSSSSTMPYSPMSANNSYTHNDPPHSPIAQTPTSPPQRPLRVDLAPYKVNLTGILSSRGSSNNLQDYWSLIDKFLRAQLSKRELDKGVKDCLGSENVYAHNDFFMAILQNAESDELPIVKPNSDTNIKLEDNKIKSEDENKEKEKISSSEEKDEDKLKFNKDKEINKPSKKDNKGKPILKSKDINSINLSSSIEPNSSKFSSDEKEKENSAKSNKISPIIDTSKMTKKQLKIWKSQQSQANSNINNVNSNMNISTGGINSFIDDDEVDLFPAAPPLPPPPPTFTDLPVSTTHTPMHAIVTLQQFLSAVLSQEEGEIEDDRGVDEDELMFNQMEDNNIQRSNNISSFNNQNYRRIKLLGYTSSKRGYLNVKVRDGEDASSTATIGYGWRRIREKEEKQFNSEETDDDDDDNNSNYHQLIRSHYHTPSVSLARYLSPPISYTLPSHSTLHSRFLLSAHRYGIRNVSLSAVSLLQTAMEMYIRECISTAREWKKPQENNQREKIKEEVISKDEQNDGGEAIKFNIKKEEINNTPREVIQPHDSTLFSNSSLKASFSSFPSTCFSPSLFSSDGSTLSNQDALYTRMDTSSEPVHSSISSTDFSPLLSLSSFSYGPVAADALELFNSLPLISQSSSLQELDKWCKEEQDGTYPLPNSFSERLKIVVKKQIAQDQTYSNINISTHTAATPPTLKRTTSTTLSINPSSIQSSPSSRITVSGQLSQDTEPNSPNSVFPLLKYTQPAYNPLPSSSTSALSLLSSEINASVPFVYNDNFDDNSPSVSLTLSDILTRLENSSRSSHLPELTLMIERCIIR